MKKLSILLVFIFALLLFASCGNTGTTITTKPAPAANTTIIAQTTVAQTTTQAASQSWNKVLEFTPEGGAGSSGVFEVHGGPVRISYDVTSNSVGGNALIYMLKEGATVSKNEKGEIEVAQYDVMALGTKKSSQTLKKDAGKYYLMVNSSSVTSLKITVEEQIMS